MKWYLKVLRNYAVFNGRSRRKEYWYFILFNIIFSFVAIFLDYILFDYNYFLDDSGGRGVIDTLYSVAMIIPTISVACRRMHDVGQSGWSMLIPIYGWIILPIRNGDVGVNNYGTDPKETE